jgi:opacity protein-like surface antigen
MKKILIAITITAVSASLSFADVGTVRRPVREERVVKERTDYSFKKSMLFAETENVADIFGTYSAIKDDTGGTPITNSNTLDDGFGAGIGLSHFFMRYWGIGLEGFAWDGDRREDWVKGVTLDALARLPLENWHIAPYLIGSLGGTFSSVDQFILGAGGGIEFRFAPNMGIFSDGRYVWADETSDFGLIRTGLRFAF